MGPITEFQKPRIQKLVFWLFTSKVNDISIFRNEFVMLDKLALLRKINLGSRVAEDEAGEIAGYFVETDQWQRVYAGETDIVYGPKGGGKSAIYSLIIEKAEELLDRNIIVAPAENPRGATVFSGLVTDPPPTEFAFILLWKLYFLTIIGKALRDWGVSNEKGTSLAGALEKVGLLPRDGSINSIFRAVTKYFKGWMDRDAESVEWALAFNGATGLPEVNRKTTFRDASDEQNLEEIPVPELLDVAENSLSQDNINLWIVIDRLDVAFAESKELERNALRALFRVYIDMYSLDQISLKIFVREDIRKRIAEGGFREASHITRTTNLTWTENQLINLIVRRLLTNHDLVEYLDVDPEIVLGDFDQQKVLLDRIFPDKVELGRNPETFKWMMGRTVDSSGINAPRELIHLVESARDAQIKMLERGEPEPDGEQLFDRAAIKEGLQEVSKVRYEQTLLAEYPEYQSYLEKLVSQKSEQTLGSLSSIWGIEESEVASIAGGLSDAGFFEIRGKGENTSYWVPFLYRDALKLVQGRADI